MEALKAVRHTSKKKKLNFPELDSNTHSSGVGTTGALGAGAPP